MSTNNLFKSTEEKLKQLYSTGIETTTTPSGSSSMFSSTEEALRNLNEQKPLTIDIATEGKEEIARASRQARKEETALYKEQAKEVATRQAEISKEDINRLVPEFESMSIVERFKNFGLSTKGVDTMLSNLGDMSEREQNEVMQNIYKQWESSRVTNPQLRGYLQGLSFNTSERASENLANKMVDMGISEESLYMGSAMRNTAAFQSGETWGRMTSRALTYWTLGGVVENLAPVRKLTELTKFAEIVPYGAIGGQAFTANGILMAGTVKAANVFVPIMIAEGAKDIVLGAPINYIRGKSLGLEGEELYRYIGQELVQDIIWNAALFGIIKTGKFALNTPMGVKMKDLLKEGNVKMSDIVNVLAEKTGLPKAQLMYDARLVGDTKFSVKYGGEDGITIGARSVMPTPVNAKLERQFLDAEGNPMSFVEFQKTKVIVPEFTVKPTKQQTAVERAYSKLIKARRQFEDAKFERQKVSELKADTAEMKLYKKELRQELANAKNNKIKPITVDANKPYFVKGDIINLGDSTVKVTDIRVETLGGTRQYVYDFELPNGAFSSQRTVDFEEAFRGSNGRLRLNPDQSLEYTATERSIVRKLEEWKAKVKELNQSRLSDKEHHKAIMALQREIDEVESVIDLLNFQNKLDKEKLKRFYMLQQKELNLSAYKLGQAESVYKKAVDDYRTAERKEWSKLRTKSKQMPDELRETVQETTNELNLRSNKVSKKTLEKGMEIWDLVDESGLKTDTPYNAAKIREFITSKGVTPPKNIDDTISVLTKKQFGDLSVDELRELTELRKYIEFVHETQGRMIATPQWRSVQTAIMQQKLNSANYLKAAQEVENPLQKSARWLIHSAYTRPQTVAKRMFRDNPEAEKLFRRLFDSEVDRLGIQQQAESMLARSFERANIKNSWEFKRLKKGTDTFTLSNGKTLKLTKMEQAYVYLGAKNKDVFKDLQAGLRTSKQLKSTRLTVEDIKKISDNIEVNPDNVKVKIIADDIFTWLNTEARRIGNEASNALDNYSILTRDNYIFSVADANARDTEIYRLMQRRTHEGAGFLQEKSKLGNPIVAIDITDGFLAYEKGLAAYAAQAKPLRDFKAFVGNADTKMSLRAQYGDTVAEYWERLVRDLETVRTPDFVDKLITRAVKNNISANFKVIMNQHVSYLTAASSIDPRHLATTAIPDKELKAIMTEYSPLYWARQRGFNRELGDFAETFARRDLGVKGIKAMDSFTVERLWLALEGETLDLHKGLEFRSKEFNQTVAKRWTEVIRESQPMYGVLDSPELLRTGNPIARLASVYSTQRAQNYSIMYEAILDGVDGNTSLMARKMASVAVSSFALAHVNRLRRRMLYGDPDHDSILKEMGQIYLGYLPLVGNVANTFMTGYDMDNALEGFLNRSLNNAGRIGQELTKADEPANVKQVVRLASFEVSKWFLDLPFENLEREMKIVMRMVSPMTLYKYELSLNSLDENGLPKVNNRFFYDNFVTALDRGDEQFIFAVLDDMTRQGIRFENFRQAMISRGITGDQALPYIDRWKQQKAQPLGYEY